MADNERKEKTALIKNKGYAIFGEQRIKLNKSSYIRKHGNKKSLIIKAKKEEIKTATNIGLLLMKTFNIMDIMSFLSFSSIKESEN